MMTIANIQNRDNLPQAEVSPLAMVYASAAEDSYKTIPLTQDKVALVDDKHFKWLSKFKWYALKRQNGWCAVRNICKPNGKQTLIFMHRIILNAPQGMDTDHKDHNSLNNQISNLRIATRAQNMANQRKTRGSSKYKGVSWCGARQKWCAQIKFQGRNINLGRFDSEIEAARAYDRAAITYFGEFAKTNF